MVAYLTMAMSLFPDDDYEEVAAKVTGSLSDWGCWNAAWSVPTASGITQARKRLGRDVMPEIFEGVAEAVATADTRGAWLRGWRLLAIDGFEVDLPDTPANAGGSGMPGRGTTGRRSRRPGWWRWPSAARTRSLPPKSAPGRPGRRLWPAGSIRGCAR